MRARNRSSHRGFTLIEVMVALIIVAIGMLGAIQAVSRIASTSGYLRDKTIAHWIAMNRLTEVRLQKAAPSLDKSSDEVEMAGRKWKWTMEVKQTPVETIRRIDITVRPEQSPEGTRLASITGFYGTAVAPPGTTLVAWQGTNTGPQQPGDKDKDKDEDEDQQPPNEEPQEQPPEPEDPVIEDPSLPQE